MITIDIPGSGTITIENLVLDFNGTLACNGELIDGVRGRLEKLSTLINVHVITADTFGTALDALKGLDSTITVIPKKNQAKAKRHYVESLEPDRVAAIGNGKNDIAMIEKAKIGIALIQAEGAFSLTVMASDIVCTNINHALDLFLHPKRLIATMRQ